MSRLDVERIAYERVRAVTGAEASTRVPAGDGVRVMRTGGARTRVSDRAILTLDAYADLETTAEKLASDALDALLTYGGRHGGFIVYSVTSLGGPANDPDPTTERPRYTCTVEMHVRGARGA